MYVNKTMEHSTVYSRVGEVLVRRSAVGETFPVRHLLPDLFNRRPGLIDVAARERYLSPSHVDQWNHHLRFAHGECGQTKTTRGTFGGGGCGISVRRKGLTFLNPALTPTFIYTGGGQPVWVASHELTLRLGDLVQRFHHCWGIAEKLRHNWVHLLQVPLVPHLDE